MMLILGAALLALPGAPPLAYDTVQPGAYLDSTAQHLVENARRRRVAFESDIQAYQATARQRLYAGARLAGRNRTLYTRELAARVHWRRDGVGEVVVLGAREGTPLTQRGVSLPDDLSGANSDAVDLAFDPDRLQVGFTMIVSRDSSSRETSVVDPLSVGSEAHYRFAAGDSVAMRLPGGRTIRLRELRIIPRRAEFRLLRGSIWVDQESFGAVRGVFTLARPFDLIRDAPGEAPGAVRALGAVRARLDRLTMEYGLVQGRWWLPHRVYVDATAEVGVLGSYPVRFEQSYAAYRVQGAGNAALAPLATEGGSTRQQVKHCRHDRRCREWAVSLPTDTAALLQSPELQESLAEAGAVAATERDLADLGRILERSAGVVADPTPRLSLPGLASFRFNRVEGPSLGASIERSMGRFMLVASGRLGAADLEPAVELSIGERSLRSGTRLSAYRRLAGFDAQAAPPTLGGALNALLLGRDEQDYLRASGLELTGAPVRPTRWNPAWRLFAEHQHPVARRTTVSLARAWDESPFPEVRAAQRADQVGAAVTLRRATDDPYASTRGELLLSVDGQSGTYSFVRPSATVGASLPLGRAVELGVAAGAGAAFGDLPVQGLWYLGGPGSVRGFPTAALGGEAFWRARAEVARGAPAFRAVVFADAGWVGDRDAVELDPMLVSAGGGIAVLDGVFRLDLARALRGGDDWRADLYLSLTP